MVFHVFYSGGLRRKLLSEVELPILLAKDIFDLKGDHHKSNTTCTHYRDGLNGYKGFLFTNICSAQRLSHSTKIQLKNRTPEFDSNFRHSNNQNWPEG